MLGRIRQWAGYPGSFLTLAGILNATLILTIYLHALGSDSVGTGSVYGWGVPPWTPVLAFAWAIAGLTVVLILALGLDRAPRRLLVINGFLVFSLANLVACPAYLDAGRVDLWIEASLLNLGFAAAWFLVLDLVSVMLWSRTGSERLTWFNAPHLAWPAGMLAGFLVMAGLVSDAVERFDSETVTTMFVLILIAALPFHLLMEIAERMNKRDALDAARARRVAERLVASREKDGPASKEVTKADTMAAAHLAADMGARLAKKR